MKMKSYFPNTTDAADAVASFLKFNPRYCTMSHLALAEQILKNARAANPVAYARIAASLQPVK